MDLNHPLMLFLTAAKIDCPVKVEHCHFILEQESSPGMDAHFLSWETFCRERPVAFCVGCDVEEAPRTARKFEDLGFKIVAATMNTRLQRPLLQGKEINALYQ